MKYEITRSGPRIEAIGAHAGYRIRLSTARPGGGTGWPLHVAVRGSESEDEVEVPLPQHHLRSQDEALEFGYDCAVLYIDAMDHRLP
ncbi:hypothetical protein V4F39_26205 [Aquincola sp. MAHUQ-54]|uniref:Uncharacterized protein n=1 Tax=Aquincola agrisoli TaxID=3119538 RepID=A0AAW9QPW5_9BURK